MADNASDILIEAVIKWGVDTVFGIPGDGIHGVTGAMRQRTGGIRFIQTRPEDEAAFLAGAQAEYTGKAGGCLATRYRSTGMNPTREYRS